MSPKQERFCIEYLIQMNASQAAVSAGYSPKTAGAIGSENLKKPNIRNRISELQQERSNRMQVTADHVLAAIVSIAKDPNQSGMTRVKALELLGKHLGIFN